MKPSLEISYDILSVEEAVDLLTNYGERAVLDADRKAVVITQ
jgi:hypothetical protein